MYSSLWKSLHQVELFPSDHHHGSAKQSVESESTDTDELLAIISQLQADKTGTHALHCSFTYAQILWTFILLNRSMLLNEASLYFLSSEIFTIQNKCITIFYL